MTTDQPATAPVDAIARLAEVLAARHADAALPGLLTVLHPHLTTATQHEPAADVFIEVDLLHQLARLLAAHGNLELLLDVVDAARPHLAQPGDPATLAAAAALPVGLTRRELDVLQLAARGDTNGAIGRKLGLSEDTVKTHARGLYRKLGAGDRTSAVARGYDLGILTAPRAPAALADAS